MNDLVLERDQPRGKNWIQHFTRLRERRRVTFHMREGEKEGDISREGGKKSENDISREGGGESEMTFQEREGEKVSVTFIKLHVYVARFKVVWIQGLR